MNNNTLICVELDQEEIYQTRKELWKKEVNSNYGYHPAMGKIDTRLLNNMRSNAVSAVYGSGMHPNRNLWISNPRLAEVSDFVPKNKYRK